jgi:hypothetical protein
MVTRFAIACPANLAGFVNGVGNVHLAGIAADDAFSAQNARQAIPGRLRRKLRQLDGSARLAVRSD